MLTLERLLCSTVYLDALIPVLQQPESRCGQDPQDWEEETEARGPEVAPDTPHLPGGGAGSGTTWARRDSARLTQGLPGAHLQATPAPLPPPRVLELRPRSSCPAAQAGSVGPSGAQQAEQAGLNPPVPARRPEEPPHPCSALGLPRTPPPPPARPPRLPGPRAWPPRASGPGLSVHSRRRAGLRGAVCGAAGCGAAGRRASEPASRSQPRSPNQSLRPHRPSCPHSEKGGGRKRARRERKDRGRGTQSRGGSTRISSSPSRSREPWQPPALPSAPHLQPLPLQLLPLPLPPAHRSPASSWQGLRNPQGPWKADRAVGYRAPLPQRVGPGGGRRGRD